MRGLLNHLHNLIGLFPGPPCGRVRDHVMHHFGWIRSIVHQGLGANGDLIAENGGHLVGMTRAPHIAQQGNPVDGVADVLPKAGGLANPGCQQAGAKLGLQWLPEGVVLRQGQGSDKFT
ncbi:MAG TPA: hypothetical protein VHE33_15625 [Acidobacteriaceae bacterium]|nr:hypothetical protein [Acidobacteriaceae bacterium]